MAFFGKKKKQLPPTREETKRLVQQALEEERTKAQTSSGNAEIDALARQVSELTSHVERVLESEEEQSDGGGLSIGGLNIGKIFEILESLQLQTAGQYAVERATEYAKGPLDPAITTPPTYIGGDNYDPAASPTSAVNARLLKWAVNGITFLARGQVAFMFYMLVLVKWHVLDLVVGVSDDDGGALDLGGIDFGDILIFSTLFSAFANPTQNAQAANGGPLGFLSGLGGLFGFGGAGAPVLNTTPVYRSV